MARRFRTTAVSRALLLIVIVFYSGIIYLKGKSATQREFRIDPEARKRLASKPS